MTVKFGSFANISPLLDRQIEELVASVKQAAESSGYTIESPTSITNATATGGLGNILLEYAYTNYNGHLYTEIWRSSDNIFANGARAGASTAKFYRDQPSGATISDVFYYWFRNVNANEESTAWFGPVSGSISASADFDIDDLLGQLGFEHFAPGTVPIRTEAALPDLSTTPANYPVGSIIYLTTNQLLYKNVNWEWKPIVAAEDMVGEITETQISDGAISTPKLAAQAVTANELAANSIIAGKIAAGALVVDDGVMQNGYIKNALIADATITDAKIADLSADKITAGTIDANEVSITNLTVGYGAVTGIKPPADANNTQSALSVLTTINSGGLRATNTATGNYAQLIPGDIEFIEGGVVYKALRRVETGTVASGQAVVFSPAFKAVPFVMLSPNDLPTYDNTYDTSVQSLECSPIGLDEDGFTARADLVVDGSGSILYPYAIILTNTGGTGPVTRYSTTTQPNVSSIEISTTTEWAGLSPSGVLTSTVATPTLEVSLRINGSGSAYQQYYYSANFFNAATVSIALPSAETWDIEIIGTSGQYVYDSGEAGESTHYRTISATHRREYLGTRTVVQSGTMNYIAVE